MATSKRLNSLDEKFRKDEVKFDLITNDDLVCKDCKSKYEDKDMPCNTSKCKKFEIKPDEVLDGGKCNEYEKDNRR